MRKKNVFICAKKILLIIPYIFFMSLSDIFLSSPQDQPLAEILWYDIFGRLSSGNVQTLVMSIESLGVFFLFTILFGNHISVFFDSIGTFIFSRLPSRRIWISKKVIGLSIISIFYTILYLIQTEGSIGQEFTVKEIIKGDASLSVGNTAYVYQYFGFQEVDGHIEFMNTLNLMNPENDYLIFMDSSPLNAYQNEPAFILKSEFFGYIKTDHTDTLTLEGNYRDYNFSDLANYEFFSTSESVTKTLNYIRSELLKKFT